MTKKRSVFFDYFLLLIITIPTFTSLLNNQYFSIHDNQHVVRLYLLDQGIKQGYLYPRWVDGLSFGYGDPLFNFYPPLVYYLGELFHLLGFSLIWSVKLVFIFGFILASFSMYFLVKEYLGRMAGLLGAAVYSFFFYHAVNAYVRGALSEFFAMVLIPLVFLYFYRLSKKITIKNSLIFAVVTALVFLTHQLVALPMVFFLGFYFIFYLFFIKKNRWRFLKFFFLGFLLGLSLSAFYWLPMFIEKNYTFINQELGGYKLHYINPYQFWYSPWGYGGSVGGLADGMTFQLGKVPILLILISTVLFAVCLIDLKRFKDSPEFKRLMKNYLFFVFLLIFSLWMTSTYSSFVWDSFKPLWSLQFPWRFMVFGAVFVALVGSFSLFFLTKLFERSRRLRFMRIFFVGFFILLIIFKYQPYFHPQSYLNVSDKDLTTFDEIAWKQSKTVIHFIPKEAKVKKNQYGVYVLDIEKKDLPKTIYEIKSGETKVKIVKNKFAEKSFEIEAKTPVQFQLNTFNFPGWQAYLDNQRIIIYSNNDYQLITVNIPQGKHQLTFFFENTRIRILANIISFLSLIIIFIFLFQTKNEAV